MGINVDIPTLHTPSQLIMGHYRYFGFLRLPFTNLFFFLNLFYSFKKFPVAVFRILNIQLSVASYIWMPIQIHMFTFDTHKDLQLRTWYDDCKGLRVNKNLNHRSLAVP